MSKKVTRLDAAGPNFTSAGQSMCCGVFLGEDAEGFPLIDIESNDEGPVRAQVLAVASNFELQDGATILLALPRSGESPIIIGPVSNKLLVCDEEVIPFKKAEPKTVEMDGKRLVLEADREVVLRAGKGSITLHKSGKIVLKGTEIISRSTGMHKIKGATVNIN